MHGGPLKKRRDVFLGAAALLALAAAIAWTAARADDLVSKGRAVYMANCIACHNADPQKPGVLGPEIAGSSKELLQARVLSTGYPPGYTPKRTTKLMAPMPQLKDDIDALHAYLNAK